MSVALTSKLLLAQGSVLAERPQSVTAEHLCQAFEGTITGEHGIGLSLRDFLPQEVGETGVDAMRKVCDTLPSFSKLTLSRSSSLWTQKEF